MRIPVLSKSISQKNPSAKATGRLEKSEWIFLLSIIGIAAAVRFFGIAKESVWLDESYSWWDAHQSLKDLWSLVPKCDPHPPLYFVLLKYWIAALGDNVYVMRSLSLLINLLTTVVVFFAAREVHPRASWIAGILFALAPFQIYFAHEARPYALLCLGAAMILYSALRLTNLCAHSDVIKKSFKNAWWMLVLGSTIILWTNNTAILMLGALGLMFIILWLFNQNQRRLIKPVLIAGVVIAAIWAPYLPTLVQQAKGVSSDFWIQRPNFWIISEELSYMVGLNNHYFAWTMVAFMAMGLAIMVRYGAKRLAFIVGALAILPVLLSLAMSLVMTPIFISRALIGVTPAFILALAGGLAFVPKTRLRNVLIAGLITVHAAGIFIQLERPPHKEPWNQLTSQLLSEIQPTLSDTTVLVVANELALPLTYALKHAQTDLPVIRGLPADFPAPDLAARYPSGKCAPSVIGQDLSFINGLTEGRSKLVLITRKRNSYDPDNSVSAFLQSQHWQINKESFFNPGDLQVFYFSR